MNQCSVFSRYTVFQYISLENLDILLAIQQDNIRKWGEQTPVRNTLNAIHAQPQVFSPVDNMFSPVDCGS